MIMLDNRSASISDLFVGVLEEEKWPEYKIIQASNSPNKRASKLVYIEFNKPLSSGGEFEIEFSYSFDKEQGQLFSRPADDYPDWSEVHYASSVTG